MVQKLNAVLGSQLPCLKHLKKVALRARLAQTVFVVCKSRSQPVKRRLKAKQKRRSQLRRVRPKVWRVPKNLRKNLPCRVAVMKRVAKVDAPVRQQTSPLKKFAFCALKPVLYQLSSELASTPRRRPLQQRVEQVAFWLSVKAAVEALALRPTKSTVAPSCRMRAQVELLLVERQKSQMTFDLQTRRP